MFLQDQDKQPNSINLFSHTVHTCTQISKQSVEDTKLQKVLDYMLIIGITI